MNNHRPLSKLGHFPGCLNFSGIGCGKHSSMAGIDAELMTVFAVEFGALQT